MSSMHPLKEGESKSPLMLGQRKTQKMIGFETGLVLCKKGLAYSDRCSTIVLFMFTWTFTDRDTGPSSLFETRTSSKFRDGAKWCL